MITVASTTETPEQIKADLEHDRFHFAVTDETSDVTGQLAAPSTPETPKPAEITEESSRGETGESEETAAELETAPTREKPPATAQANDKDRTHKKLLKSIDRATRKWRTEESRREQLERENEQLKEKLAQQATPPSAPADQATPNAEPASAIAQTTELAEPVMPVQSDFADWGEYEQALQKYNQDLKLHFREIARAEVAAERQRQEKSAQQDEAARFWQGIASRGREKYADWDQVTPKAGTAEDVQYAPEVAAVIAASPVSHDLLYHLARNPSDARYLADIHPAIAARELGRLEAYLEGVAAQPPAAPAAETPPNPAPQAQPRVTPPSPKTAPISPVNPAGASMGTTDTGKLTPRQYREGRRNGSIH